MIKFCTTMCLLLLAPFVWGKHQIKYEVSPLGNLVYQLDCMTQPAMFPCSQPDFIELWQVELKPDNSDAAMLKRWKSSRMKLDISIEYTPLADDKMATSPNFPVNSSNGINVLEQVRIMAFAAADLDSYRHMLRFWLSINQVNEELAILRHFWPRFEPWFGQRQTGLQQFASDAELLSKKHDVDGLLTAMRTFYQSDLPEELQLPVYLVAHPKQNAGTSGLVFNENSVVEVLKDEKAINRLAIVIHEISHFYHERATLETHIKHMDFFTNKDSLIGKVGYYLFNEAMATAIGNGILDERLHSPEYFKKYMAIPLSFYNNKGIDQAAKAALSLVSKQINHQKPIDHEFLVALDNIWAKSLKDIKDSPEQLLRHVGLVILDGQYDGMINDIMGIIQPSSAQINTSTDVRLTKPLVTEQYPQLDTLVIASTWQQVKPLNLPGFAIDPQLKEGMKVVISDNGVTYIVIVSSSKDYILMHIKQMMQWSDFTERN